MQLQMIFLKGSRRRLFEQGARVKDKGLGKQKQIEVKIEAEIKSKATCPFGHVAFFIYDLLS